MQVQGKYTTIAIGSILLGSSSLLCFFYFVILGPFNLLNLYLNPTAALLINTFLLIIFFSQHSLMIRKTVRAKIEPYLPAGSFYALHCICTSLLLLQTVLFWQITDIIIFTVQKPYIYICYVATIMAIAGLFWAIISLKHFDPFGRKQISNYLKRKQLQKTQFTITGPYHLTRHPFYFFILLMIWSYPILSVERLLFNFTWTIWVVIGTLLEERDLQDDIGTKYIEYKREVPMLIPYKLNKILVNKSLHRTR